MVLSPPTVDLPKRILHSEYPTKIMYAFLFPVVVLTSRLCHSHSFDHPTSVGGDYILSRFSDDTRGFDW
jgi:hypothetical protein